MNNLPNVGINFSVPWRAWIVGDCASITYHTNYQRDYEHNKCGLLTINLISPHVNKWSNLEYPQQCQNWFTQLNIFPINLQPCLMDKCMPRFWSINLNILICVLKIDHEMTNYSHNTWNSCPKVFPWIYKFGLTMNKIKSISTTPNEH